MDKSPNFKLQTSNFKLLVFDFWCLNFAAGHSTLPVRQAQGSLSDSRRLRDEPSIRRPEAAHGSKAGSDSKRGGV